jgi:hypothetical protein
MYTYKTTELPINAGRVRRLEIQEEGEEVEVERMEETLRFSTSSCRISSSFSM